MAENHHHYLEHNQLWDREYQKQIPTRMASDPYMSNYYGNSFPYQFGIGEGPWSNNEAQMAFLSGYSGQIGGHDPYTSGIEGGVVSGGFGGTAPYNFFHGNADAAPSWASGSVVPPGQSVAPEETHFSDQPPPSGQYYRPHHYRDVNEQLGRLETGMEGLSLDMEKEVLKDIHRAQMPTVPAKTWASVASLPARPHPIVTHTKKKSPGMPPPPVIPGKLHIDEPWDTKSIPNDPSNYKGNVRMSQSTAWLQQVQNNQGTAMAQNLAAAVYRPSQPMQIVLQQNHPQAVQPSQPNISPPQMQASVSSAVKTQEFQQKQNVQKQKVVDTPEDRPHPTEKLQQQHHQPVSVCSSEPLGGQMPTPQQISHPVLKELYLKNDYNPVNFDLSADGARFFVIKSYSEDDIHRSIKYEIWCSTEHGNKRLDQAYRERESHSNGCVYLFFSVNGSGHFCGMARMMSPVDYTSSSSVWCLDKWKGQFKVRWIYVKDVPNFQLKHIKLENNENKPVTKSRDTQEVPLEKGRMVLRIIHEYKHCTSIFDDFIHYERRQQEEDNKKYHQAVRESRNNFHGSPTKNYHHHHNQQHYHKEKGEKGNVKESSHSSQK